jgi:hypothetical protein
VFEALAKILASKKGVKMPLNVFIPQIDIGGSPANFYVRLFDKDTYDLPETLSYLVRESIQNSTDAYAERQTEVQVDFNLHLRPSKITDQWYGRYFSKLYDISAKKFDFTSPVLEIRDNARGLTGSIDKIEATNNFSKLVYLFGAANSDQNNNQRGGSWGVGKTLYFQRDLSQGFVVYYTRCMEADGSMQSKLVACYIANYEDQSKLSEDLKTEKCLYYWPNIENDGKRTYALTDESEIKNILAHIGVKPFSGNETGTSVIIPLNPSISDETDKLKEISRDLLHFSWKWYFPRMANDAYLSFYKLPKLSVHVKCGNTPEQISALHKQYQKFQTEIYNHGLAYLKSPTAWSESHQTEKTIDIYEIRNHDNRLGILVCSKKDWSVKIGSESFLKSINEASKDQSNVFFTYLRSSGMIINYDLKSYSSNTSDDVFSIFIVDPNASIVHPRSGHQKVENLLRLSERENHAQWRRKEPVVKIIFDQVNGLLETHFKQNTKSFLNETLGQKISEILGFKIDVDDIETEQQDLEQQNTDQQNTDQQNTDLDENITNETNKTPVSTIKDKIKKGTLPKKSKAKFTIKYEDMRFYNAFDHYLIDVPIDIFHPDTNLTLEIFIATVAGKVSHANWKGKNALEFLFKFSKTFSENQNITSSIVNDHIVKLETTSKYRYTEKKPLILTIESLKPFQENRYGFVIDHAGQGNKDLLPISDSKDE